MQSALVLFDIDGTLMRGAGPHHKNALMEGIRRVTGRETTLAGVATQGMLDCDLLANMLRASGHAEEAIGVDLTAIMAECQNAYLENCAPDLRPFLCVGVPEFLSELRNRGALLGLVTGNLSAIGWKKMELAGIRDYFRIGAFAEDGPTRADLARIASERAWGTGLLSRQCRVSLIGDHPNDIRAAKANGFQAIGVATGLSSVEELQAADPDIVVRDLRELQTSRLL